MSLKFIQYALFLLITFGALVVGLAFHDGRGFMIVFLGVTVGFYAFLFVPYYKKFYLSELLLIVFAIAIEMTLVQNMIRNSAHPLFILFTFVFFPFITFVIINKRRPRDERFPNAAVSRPTRPSRVPTWKLARKSLYYDLNQFPSYAAAWKCATEWSDRLSVALVTREQLWESILKALRAQ